MAMQTESTKTVKTDGRVSGILSPLVLGKNYERGTTILEIVLWVSLVETALVLMDFFATKMNYFPGTFAFDRFGTADYAVMGANFAAALLADETVAEAPKFKEAYKTALKM